MIDTLKHELEKHGIDLWGSIPMSACNIVRPHKLRDMGDVDTNQLSVILFAIPYLTDHKHRNISAYAVSRDYHLFATQLFDSVLPLLRQKFSPYKFLGFADNSPISEVPAAAMAGLGIIGDNMMLITEKYSSFVFLGEIVTDYPINHPTPQKIQGCEHCGACKAACPMDKIGACLSALTQKKGELTASEAAHVASCGSAWGCDICQNVCPHTLRAKSEGTIYTDIEFFRQDNTPHLTSEDIQKMTDGQFAERAYSWRGRNTILRNLKILEHKNEKEDT